MQYVQPPPHAAVAVMMPPQTLEMMISNIVENAWAKDREEREKERKELEETLRKEEKEMADSLRKEMEETSSKKMEEVARLLHVLVDVSSDLSEAFTAHE
jgi:F0F1-type ATP synthase membrane subunit b/b'